MSISHFLVQGVMAFYGIAFLIFLVLVRKAPYGREIPFVGFVYTDRNGRIIR